MPNFLGTLKKFKIKGRSRAGSPGRDASSPSKNPPPDPPAKLLTSHDPASPSHATQNITRAPSPTVPAPAISTPVAPPGVSFANAPPTVSAGAPNPSPDNTPETTQLIPTEIEDHSEPVWDGLKTLLGVLESSAKMFGPLKSAISGLNECVEIYDVRRFNCLVSCRSVLPLIMD